MFDNLSEEERKYRRNLIIFFPICLLISFVFSEVGRMNMTPFWLNGAGGFLGAMIGGPIYGAMILLVSIALHMMRHFELLYLLTIFPLIAGIVTFGFLTRMGYFRHIKGACVTTAGIAFVRTMTMTPMIIATTGGQTVDNNLAEGVFAYLVKGGYPVPIATFLEQAVGNLIDSGLIIFFAFALLHLFWKFWDEHFDVKAMEVIKIAVVEEKKLDN